MLVHAQFGYVHPSAPLRTGPDRRNRLDPVFLHYFNTVLRPSVRQHGVKQAVICHSDGSGGEVVVDGRSRLDAALLEGLDRVPRLLYPQPLDTRQIDLAAFASNTQRCDFSFAEKAAFLIDTKAALNCPQAQLARELCMDKSDVTRHIRPFLRLPKELLEKAGSGEGQIPARALYALSQLDDPAAVAELADKVVRGLKRVEDLEDDVRALKGGKKVKKAKRRLTDGGICLEFPAELTPEQLQARLADLLKKHKRGS